MCGERKKKKCRRDRDRGRKTASRGVTGSQEGTGRPVPQCPGLLHAHVTRSQDAGGTERSPTAGYGPGKVHGNSVRLCL